MALSSIPPDLYDQLSPQLIRQLAWTLMLDPRSWLSLFEACSKNPDNCYRIVIGVMSLGLEKIVNSGQLQDQDIATINEIIAFIDDIININIG